MRKAFASHSHDGGRVVAGRVAVALPAPRPRTGVLTRPPCQLYLITRPAIADLAIFGRALEAALDAGDVAALQVRLKDVTR